VILQDHSSIPHNWRDHDQFTGRQWLLTQQYRSL